MAKEKKAEVLGLTRNNDQYKNVPDDLKWAIPLIEIQKDPAFIAAERANYAAIVERVKKEKAAQSRQPLQLVKNVKT